MIPLRVSKNGEGSPPRVRGEGVMRFCGRPGGRITPACAGRSCTGSRPRPRSGDHPRVCGAKRGTCTNCSRGRGSPPRVRGEDILEILKVDLQGITPACAGRSSPARTARRPRKDHPRVCGEKEAASVCAEAGWGSPPRVRGEDMFVAHIAVAGGITPACAGRSREHLQMRLQQTDHPRVCGEKGASSSCALMMSGSPPRVRGEDVCLEDLRGVVRITPACAGRSQR